MNEADLYVIKKELRRRMNDLRDSISKEERENASEKAAAKVILSKDFIQRYETERVEGMTPKGL